MLGCEADASKLCPITDLALAGNGLRYTGISGEFATEPTVNVQNFITGNPSTQSVNYINLNMNSTNICAIRGMRLPMITEMKVTGAPWAFNPYGNGGLNGVPAHPSSKSWIDGTSTASSSTWNNSGNFYPLGLHTTSNLTTNEGVANGWNYVRCVR